MGKHHRVVVLLGSNIDKERNIPAAATMLHDATHVLAISAVYETTAAGASQEQPSYFNAALILLTDQTPEQLKDGLLADIEQKLGRKRTSDRFAARTIDLDIALFDNEIIDYVPADGRLHHIPDPDLLHYAHCTVPVADLLPDMPHPETGERLRDIADRLLADIDTNKAVFRPRLDVVLG